MDLKPSKSSGFNLKENSKKADANEREARLAKQLGGYTQPASGAIRGFKGDIKLDDFLMDSKGTVGEYLNIKTKEFVKITKESLENRKHPAIIFTFEKIAQGVSKDWVAIPVEVFAELLEKGS